jgi:pyruvate formate lyase activating enzyme
MQKAILFQTLENQMTRCEACHHHCLIRPGKRGLCGVRENQGGTLYLLVYNKPVALQVDPMEKKPLFHFLPGQKILSLGTLGCNFGCLFCQNFDISQAPKTEPFSFPQIRETTPQEIVQYALKHKIPAIAYTYNEPTIWTEYALEIMKLAHRFKIKNVWVSNGFFTEQTLKLIQPYLDAINIDLKSNRQEFYQKICQGRLEPVKENIKKIYQLGIWEEITTLVIPGLNDSDKELEEIARFLFEISPSIVWHLSAFYPAYKMTDRPPTPFETLKRGYEIGKKIGLRYIYTGNIANFQYESTYCPNCQALLIKRWGLELLENHLKNGSCPHCHFKIEGRWS